MNKLLLYLQATNPKIEKLFIEQKAKEKQQLTAVPRIEACESELSSLTTKINGERIITVVNTPAFMSQPKIEGDLNPAFKTWEQDYYFVHKVDDNTFTLMPKENDTANAINQVFTLPGLATSNSGILKENYPVDFLTIGSSFSMRKAGISEIIFNNLNCNEIEFIGNGYCNSSGYIFSNSYSANFGDFYWYSNVGRYESLNGFLCGNTNSISKNIINTIRIKVAIRKKMVDCIYSISSFKCQDDDKFAYNGGSNYKQHAAYNGVGFNKNGLDCPKNFTSLRFGITYPYIFRNGFELIAIKRSI